MHLNLKYSPFSLDLLYNILPSDKILLFQIESNCRQQHKCGRKIQILFGKGRKHCGKRRKCWSSAFSPFPTMFLKAICFKKEKMLVTRKQHILISPQFFYPSQKKLNFLYGLHIMLSTGPKLGHVLKS